MQGKTPIVIDDAGFARVRDLDKIVGEAINIFVEKHLSFVLIHDVRIHGGRDRNNKKSIGTKRREATRGNGDGVERHKEALGGGGGRQEPSDSRQMAKFEGLW